MLIIYFFENNIFNECFHVLVPIFIYNINSTKILALLLNYISIVFDL